MGMISDSIFREYTWGERFIIILIAIVISAPFLLWFNLPISTFVMGIIGYHAVIIMIGAVRKVKERK